MSFRKEKVLDRKISVKKIKIATKATKSMFPSHRLEDSTAIQFTVFKILPIN